ncbi:dTMP kinase [Legionella longbeachae]|uniref:Thymidylate kinase n=1 Tax=Legionella longbeachae serogroup 1 (strain NSW150) TaxID=661367 RepID=D3HSG6_LEGLN|nr:dTMP kinase [Legionella longbeachae]VEE02349.1 thymidylate kinase [Legionella oakridgensis]HBD7398160.1 dTMP kinase [Legionella pneumophila]ARB91366.1 dTMP kinase [Legionella longbeachae]ARM32209.1 dTMP kinase [Legionella longbeachae]EEZ95011.1 thymidylate kinase [Legionella longbeachae D-4968]
MISSMGKLIVIEGLEGAGKSTAVNTVVDLLAERQIKTITTREPGGTAIGEILRNLIKNPEYRDVLDDRSELLLLYTARIQLLKQVIEPALQKGMWVIADRFELSTMAYQGGGRGLDQEMIRHLSSFSLQGLKPDLTLYLDISPEEGMRRVKSRGTLDRIEQQSIEFFHRVHDSYLQYIKMNPYVVRINAALPLKNVQLALQKAINEFIEHQT